ncbi:WYL domain-containing protein [Anoxybacillus flavithermus]|uniref:WYL domain-containing protein n=1 Tax=Anoxybacillus flavithermus TaxID=33934 RepID=UPI0018663239|nr:WYL domain-containing protein [Anoxybacillus flavithermus]
MDKEKEAKISRVLKLYDTFRKGGVINKKRTADELGVNERTIQRDIDDIRMFLSNNCAGEEILYDFSKKGYYLSGFVKNPLTGVELLSIIKIILESRAFCKSEMNGLIDALLSQATEEDRKFIKTIIGNELIHFQPLQHNKPLLKMIWDIGFSIRNKQMIEITYERMDGKESVRIVKPVSIIFSEYYFYLIAFIKDSEYQSPAFFRVDRIKHFKLLQEKFKYSEKDRIEEGELRKRIQFMYAGDLMTIRFKFFGLSLSAVLDRFPNAKVIEDLPEGWLIEAEVYGKGCVMWLLSQGERVEVISPQSLRDEMKRTIQLMADKYD